MDMDRDTRADHRDHIAQGFARIATELYALEDYYQRHELPPDLVTEDEWPFSKALEDTRADVSAAAERIEMINDLLHLQPITITVQPEDYWNLVEKLEQAPRELPELAAFLHANEGNWPR